MILDFLKKKEIPGIKKVSGSVQNSIPYTQVYDNGVIETTRGTFTKAYNLEDVNFTIAPEDQQEDYYRAYEAFLDMFPSDVSFQIVIWNHEGNKRKLLENIRFMPENDGLNGLRSEMNELLVDKMLKGRNCLDQSKYLVVSVKDDSVDHAMVTLDGLDININKAIKKISRDLNTRPMSLKKRLKILHEIYNPGETFPMEGKKIDFKSLRRYGLTTKDVIAPSGIEYKPGHFQVGGKYGKCYFLKTVPGYLSSEFLSDLASINARISISMNYRPIDQARAMRMIRNHMISVNAQIAAEQKNALKSGYTLDLISPELRRSQKQNADLMDSMLSRNQKLFYMSFTVTAFADSKNELDEIEKQIKTVANGHKTSIIPLFFQQEAGFTASLPLGVDRLSTSRLYTTEAASIFIPYTSQELLQRNGIYYGVNELTKNLILYSRLTGKNYNGLFFGQSGSGKSFTTKAEIMSILLRDGRNRVFVIDPDAEYISMAEKLGGEVMDISAGSRTFLNPLDMDVDTDGSDDPLSMKADYVLGMIEIMLLPSHTLDPRGRSIVDRCVKNIYRGYLEHIDGLRKIDPSITCDKAASPTLRDLYNELLEQPEEEAQTIANIIELYATGSQALFSNRTKADTDARFVVYNIKNLGTGMRNLGLFVCLNEVWTKMAEGQKSDKWTYIYIDEMHVLLKCDSAVSYLRQLFKRSRKYNGVVTGITQGVEDLTRSDETRDILHNTSFIMMNSLSKADADMLGNILQIPDSQMSYATAAEKGHGLLYTGRTVIPFNNEYDTSTEMYKIMSSSQTIDKMKETEYDEDDD